MSPITTHVLDTSLGRPAAGVAAVLDRRAPDGAWKVLGQGVTDADGRIRDLLQGPLETGTFRLTFDTGAYFRAQGKTGFYPTVLIVFEIVDASQHHHVPLLLSPFGYSTYRGS